MARPEPGAPASRPYPIRSNLQEYVSDLVASLKFSLCHDQEAVALEFDIVSTRFSPNLLFPLGLIITEPVTNSLKHAFRKSGSGRIRLSLAREGAYWILVVRDNGTPPADKKSIFDSTSLGMMLVLNLVLQIGGTMDTDLAGGTCFTIRFPHETASDIGMQAGTA